MSIDVIRPRPLTVARPSAAVRPAAAAAPPAPVSPRRPAIKAPARGPVANAGRMVGGVVGGLAGAAGTGTVYGLCAVAGKWAVSGGSLGLVLGVGALIGGGIGLAIGHGGGRLIEWLFKK